MKRKAILTTQKITGMLAGGLAFSFSMASCNAGEEKSKPFNFLVIMADDVSPELYGCYGNKDANTPNIDKLAKNGILFNTCWAAPICSPSRAMIMTGRYAHRTGWYHNALRVPDEKGETDFLINHLTFLSILKSRGYATALAGKWQIPSDMNSPKAGIDEYCVWEPSIQLHPKGSAFKGLKEDEQTLARYWYPSIMKNGQLVNTKPDDFGPDIVTDFLIDFIERNKEKPFLAYYPMILPHGTRDGRTTTPLTGITGDHMNGTFQENVDYTDVLVGRLIKTLEKHDLLENTLVIFTSDNPMPNKNHATDKGLKVPLIVHCPDIIKVPRNSDELISFADILPTLTDLAGASLPKGYEIDGKSMVPYLRGESQVHREWLFSYVGTARMVRTKKWVLEAVDPWSGSPSGRLYDCAGKDCIEIKDEKNEEAVEIRKYFDEVLDLYPSPDTNDVIVKKILESYKDYQFRHKLGREEREGGEGGRGKKAVGSRE